jgi:hypothetical protein
MVLNGFADTISRLARMPNPWEPQFSNSSPESIAMSRLCRRVAGFTVVFALSVGLAVGCQKKSPSLSFSENESDKHGLSGSLREALANEDPEVADYIKRKGWSLLRGPHALGKELTFLNVRNSEKPSEEVTLTDSDYRMIARSRISI